VSKKIENSRDLLERAGEGEYNAGSRIPLLGEFV
jgi:hypothetical protein